MAQAWRSGGDAFYNTADSATDRTITAGSGWAEDDILIFAGYANQSSMAFTLPTGWTELYNLTDTSFAAVLGWIARGASDPDLTFGVGTSSSRTPEVFISAFTGCDPTSPIVASASGAVTSVNNSVSCDPPSIDCGAVSSLVVTGCTRRVLFDWDPTPGPPSGYTMRRLTVTATSRGGLASATSDALATGTVDPGIFTGHISGTGIIWHGWTVGLAPAAGGGGIPRVYHHRQRNSG